MTESLLTSEDFLLQLDMTEEVMPKIGKQPWQTLYLSADVRPHRLGMWRVLPDEEAAAKAHDSWDGGLLSKIDFKQLLLNR